MGFQQGLSGLNAASKNLDVIGNNIANSNTVGYKDAQAHFADVFANSLAASGGSTVGIGVSVSGVDQSFSQGNVTSTSNPLDLAVNGDGFFRLNSNGSTVYGRNGQFKLDKDGYVVNDSGAKLTGYLPNSAGVLVTSSPVDLNLSSNDIPPAVTTEVNAVLNLDSRSSTLLPASFNLTNSATYTSSTSVNVYDSLGNSHVMSLYFLKSAANTWQVFGANDGTQIGAAPLGTINFKTDGSIDTATTTLPFNVSTAVTTGATTPLAFTLDFTGSTQFGSSFGVNQLTQDGATSGHLSGFSISADGVIKGRYSNGLTTTLGQVALANFTNKQGLQPLSDNVWAETSASGQPLVGPPTSGSLGAIQSGAVEESNVDVTSELVNMIAAQRNFQANAQTIKTQDSIFQTLINGL